MKSMVKQLITIVLLGAIIINLVGCNLLQPREADNNAMVEQIHQEEASVPEATDEPTEADLEDEEAIAPADVGANLISVEDLVAELSLRFSEEDGFDYTEPLIDVPRDYTFTFDITPEAIERLSEIHGADGRIQVDDFIRIYRDSAFTQDVAFSVGGDADLFNELTYLTISPFRTPVFSLYDPAIGGHLFHRGEFQDWGNANQYFLVRYYDLTTGERLTRPLVTVFNIATEIAGAPRIEFTVSDDGIGGLVWDPVDGAEEYAIIRVLEGKDGRDAARSAYLIEITTETYWKDTLSRNTNFSFLTSEFFTIDYFFNYYMSQEDGEELSLEEFLARDWNFEIERHQDVNWYFGVIAFNREGTSSISNLLDIRTLASQVPVGVANHLNRGGIRPTGLGTNSTARLNHDLLSAPSHAWVLMADGNVNRHLIDYQVDIAREQTLLEAEFEYDEEDNPVIVGDLIQIPTLVIPYRIEGTSFRGYVQIIEPEGDFERALLVLENRQHRMRTRTGDLIRHVQLNPERTDDATTDEQPPEIGEIATELRGDFDVFASSPLSAFLALQMMNGQTRINLDDFPEASNHEYLVEAWFEAVLQNPLVLGARSLRLCWLTGDIIIIFDQDSDIIARQQQAIKDKVDEIVMEIITPGMTDLEMQTAINYFLISHATYDFDALDNAESNNFTHVDPEFFDSFTAYGILLNGVGVCSGYADAFALIARRAGLETVVVTGFLKGSLPHAWNRVNIDGQWYTLDVTNNDNEFFPNAFFNLSDDEAATILTEDTQWVLDRELHNFVATSAALTEYYRYHNRFFDPDEIVDVLVERLLANGRATYRTNVLLSDEQFQAILAEVILQSRNPDITGGHFLGVITLFE